jgi:hypothetical protein
VEALLTEETIGGDDAAQPCQGFQERRGKAKRPAAPRGIRKVSVPEDQADEASEFELQLRSTLA